MTIKERRARFDAAMAAKRHRLDVIGDRLQRMDERLQDAQAENAAAIVRLDTIRTILNNVR